MKNIAIVAIVTGTVERLNICLCKGKIVLFVFLSPDTLHLCDKSHPERIIRLEAKKIQSLVCEIYNLRITSEIVWQFMPGNQVSFEGVIGSDKKRNMMIVSSIRTNGETTRI